MPSRPRFIADADLNPRIADGLRRIEPALDFLDAHETGVIGLADTDVLLISARLGRILVSCDRNTMIRHFRKFVAQQSSPGLIIVEQDFPIGDAIEELLMIWAASDAQEWCDAVAFLPL